jgi:hypothetical protein
MQLVRGDDEYMSTAKNSPPEEIQMKATVSIIPATGPEFLTVDVDDYDPFTMLTLRDVTVPLTRDECRMVSDALRAASLREPY